MATTAPLLLDTQHFLWWQEGSPRIAPPTIALIEGAPQVFVSAMTAVEIAVKVAIASGLTLVTSDATMSAYPVRLAAPAAERVSGRLSP
jgi:PIN domain nuclease of toxin-antitoxin system